MKYQCYGKSYWLYLILFSLIPTCFANFEFSPITASITTKGKGSHHIAQVTNRGTEQIPVIISLTERIMLPDGKEERPTTQDLGVFPSQFVLGPKETKLVKVSWMGPAELDFEKAYRIIVEQVSVDFAPKKKNKGNIKILINYVGTIYVNSKINEPEVVLTNVTPSADGKKFIVALNNKGNAHTILKAPVLEVLAKIKGKEQKVIIKGTMLSAIDGKNLLARSQMNVEINKPPYLEGAENLKWKFLYTE